MEPGAWGKQTQRVQACSPSGQQQVFENATSQLICLTRSGLVALGQGGIGPLVFHILYVKHNIEKLWNFISPPPETFSTRSQAALQSAEMRASLVTVYPSPSTKFLGMGGARRLGWRDGLGVAYVGGPARGRFAKGVRG